MFTVSEPLNPAFAVGNSEVKLLRLAANATVRGVFVSSGDVFII